MNRWYLLVVSFAITLAFFGISDAAVRYTVKKGDTPYSIAQKFQVSHHDILKINGISAKRLQPGSRILIPLQAKRKSHESAASKNAPTSHTAEALEQTGNEQTIGKESFHVVRKGDTISSLARKYGIAPRELMEINEMSSTKLKIGQKIALKRIDAEEYIVQPGDTVWEIAKKFHLAPDELIAMNALQTDTLKPGQKIMLKRAPEVVEAKTYEAVLSNDLHIDMNDEHVYEGLQDQTAETSSLQKRIMLFAKKMLNIPYRFGGNSLFGIDCSAFVKKVYSLIGIDLPRSAREQFNEGIPVDVANLTIGDLVFFKTYAPYPSHVGIYLGNNLFIHASSKSKKVTIDSMDTPFYLKRFIGAKRLLDARSMEQNVGADG